MLVKSVNYGRSGNTEVQGRRSIYMQRKRLGGLFAGQIKGREKKIWKSYLKEFSDSYGKGLIYGKGFSDYHGR